MKPALVLAALALLAGAARADVAADLLLTTDAPRLADYGLFDAAGIPAQGVTPYALNTPLYSDGAEKSRFVWMPPGTSATWRTSGPLAFPVGTVLIKRFAFAADQRQPGQNLRAIETRLLIHRRGGWVALSYVEQAGSAVLKRAGQRLPVALINQDGLPQTIDYAVPNQNQCKTCHQSGETITPIGPTAANLNNGLPGNQLMLWQSAGRLTGLPAGNWPRLARWNDVSEPLDARARAYLAVNCAHCHNRTGFASNSGLYLGPEEANPTNLGIFKRPVAAGRGSGGFAFSITPGQPDASIMVHRMAATEPGVMMPQLGRSLVHGEGIALIRQWIASLPAVPAPSSAAAPATAAAPSTR